MNLTPLKEIINDANSQNSGLKKKFIEHSPISKFEFQSNKENSCETIIYLKERIAMVVQENEKLNNFILKKDKEYFQSLESMKEEISNCKTKIQCLTLTNSILQETLQKKQEMIQSQEEELERRSKKLLENNERLELLEQQINETSEELKIYSELEQRSESLIEENLKLSEALKQLNRSERNKKAPTEGKSQKTIEGSVKEIKAQAKARIKELKVRLKKAEEESHKYKEDAFFYQEELANALNRIQTFETKKDSHLHIESHLQKLREEIKQKDQMIKDFHEPSFMSSIETAHEGMDSQDRVIEQLQREKAVLISELEDYKDIDAKIERLTRENERLNVLLHENTFIRRPFPSNLN